MEEVNVFWFDVFFQGMRRMGLRPCANSETEREADPFNFV